MKPGKYTAVAAFLGRHVAAPRRAKPAAERLESLSRETGVSVRALALFAKIGDHGGFTADAAHHDFGNVKLKEVA